MHCDLEFQLNVLGTQLRKDPKAGSGVHVKMQADQIEDDGGPAGPAPGPTYLAVRPGTGRKQCYYQLGPNVLSGSCDNFACSS
jgi:hypothetical protein